MPGESLFKYIIGFFIIFIIAAFTVSEIIHNASPLFSHSSHEMIDETLKDKIVGKESDEAFYSLKGEDKNKNGLRDDVERVIQYQYSYKKGMKGRYYNQKNIKFFESKILFLMKKMQSLTKDEDIFNAVMSDDFELDDLGHREAKRYIKFYIKRKNIHKFSSCLFDYINNQDLVGTGAEYFQIIRTQLNTKKRRTFFGETMLFRGSNIFESFIAHPPRDRFKLYLYGDTLKRYNLENEFINDCKLKEF